MSFISLPDAFARAGQVPSFQIARLIEGAMVPVATLRGERDSPVDAQKLSENVASLLNGRNPMHFLGGKKDMYFERFNGGINFRARNRGQAGGLTTVAATLTAMAGFEDIIARCIEESPEAMTLFMKAANSEERRNSVRAPDARPAARGSKPPIA